MTYSARPLPVPLPVSSFLPPQKDAPTDALPLSLAILGPLPPTTPIHLALNYLYLSDLPEFEQAPTVDDQPTPLSSSPRRALIITTSRDDYCSAVKEDDEDHIRERGGDYTVLDRLRRVDVRYCPTVKHVMLLLSLLTGRRGREATDGAGAQTVPSPPGLIILWNVGSLLMDTEGVDENSYPSSDATLSSELRGERAKKKFKRDTVISDYLNILSAAQATTAHFSSLDVTTAPTSLLVFEPDLTPDCSLPVFPPGKSDETVPKASREKRIALRTGIERLLGPDCFGGVTPAHVDEQGAAVYTLSLARYPDDSYTVRRRRCSRAEWASAMPAEGESRDGVAVEGDLGGWRWEWT